jgi:hypothetical protein
MEEVSGQSLRFDPSEKDEKEEELVRAGYGRSEV